MVDSLSDRSASVLELLKSKAWREHHGALGEMGIATSHAGQGEQGKWPGGMVGVQTAQGGRLSGGGRGRMVKPKRHA